MSDRSQAIYIRLGHLIASMPDGVDHYPQSPAVLDWLAEVQAVARASGDGLVAADLITTVMSLLKSFGAFDDGNRTADANRIYMLLKQLLFSIELRLPASAQGAFITAGNAVDALLAVGRVLQSATADVLIVDPYMDQNMLTDFAVQAQDKVAIRLLADAKNCKPGLRPMVLRWSSQYPIDRWKLD